MTDQQATSLEAYLDRESAARVPPSIQAVAEAARLHHGASVLAILFYGSCLRDGGDEGKIVDLYLLVSGYREALANPVSAALARLLPPNVYYIETGFDRFEQGDTRPDLDPLDDLHVLKLQGAGVSGVHL